MRHSKSLTGMKCPVFARRVDFFSVSSSGRSSATRFTVGGNKGGNLSASGCITALLGCAMLPLSLRLIDGD